MTGQSDVTRQGPTPAGAPGDEHEPGPARQRRHRRRGQVDRHGGEDAGGGGRGGDRPDPRRGPSSHQREGEAFDGSGGGQHPGPTVVAHGDGQEQGGGRADPCGPVEVTPPGGEAHQHGHPNDGGGQHHQTHVHGHQAEDAGRHPEGECGQPELEGDLEVMIGSPGPTAGQPHPARRPGQQRRARLTEAQEEAEAGHRAAGGQGPVVRAPPLLPFGQRQRGDGHGGRRPRRAHDRGRQDEPGADEHRSLQDGRHPIRDARREDLERGHRGQTGHHRRPHRPTVGGARQHRHQFGEGDAGHRRDGGAAGHRALGAPAGPGGAERHRHGHQRPLTGLGRAT